jgi:hypothetical protein
MRRGQISAFIERHNTAWELSMATLAVVYLGVAFSIDDGVVLRHLTLDPVRDYQPLQSSTFVQDVLRQVSSMS